MRFNVVAILACVGLASASAIPAHSHADGAMSLAERSPLEARDSYDCAGSSMCSSLAVSACDNAVNTQLQRNDDVLYGADGSGRPFGGTCSEVLIGYGCGIFIQGKSHCARTGNEIWWDYQDIRNSGCRVCGSKHWGDGCYTTINYVSGCVNRVNG